MAEFVFPGKDVKSAWWPDSNYDDAHDFINCNTILESVT